MAAIALEEDVATGDGTAPHPTQGSEPAAQPRERLGGPLKTIYAFWLAGMSCDGCTIAVSSATNPPVESLLTGTLPGLPLLKLYHPVLSVEVGEEFVDMYYRAWRGELDAPYVVILEGSVPDETIAAAQGGYWAALGVGRPGDEEFEGRPIPVATWLARLAPGAAAAVAIGTCATWGGIPAAAGNPTNAMGMMDFLGHGYRSALGLPVINIPGCSPVGDNFTEVVAAVLMFLQGMGPLPEFDELGRPAWLFNETVHRKCVRAGWYEEGTFAEGYGDPECLVEIGCWGPVVQCNITSRGAINHMGGCMNTGGVCIGCTMPGFPDRFSPFYVRPPGTVISSSSSRSYGMMVRNLRRLTQRYMNLTPRWEEEKHVPSAWGDVPEPKPHHKMAHFFYSKLQFLHHPRPGAYLEEAEGEDG